MPCRVMACFADLQLATSTKVKPLCRIAELRCVKFFNKIIHTGVLSRSVFNMKIISEVMTRKDMKSMNHANQELPQKRSLALFLEMRASFHGNFLCIVQI